LIVFEEMSLLIEVELEGVSKASLDLSSRRVLTKAVADVLMPRVLGSEGVKILSLMDMPTLTGRHKGLAVSLEADLNCTTSPSDCLMHAISTLASPSSGQCVVESAPKSIQYCRFYPSIELVRPGAALVVVSNIAVVQAVAASTTSQGTLTSGEVGKSSSHARAVRVLVAGKEKAIDLMSSASTGPFSNECSLEFAIPSGAEEVSIQLLSDGLSIADTRALRDLLPGTNEITSHCESLECKFTVEWTPRQGLWVNPSSLNRVKLHPAVEPVCGEGLPEISQVENDDDIFA